MALVTPILTRPDNATDVNRLYAYTGGTTLAPIAAATARANLEIDKRTGFSNANYTVLTTDKVIAQSGTLSAPRTVTLPSASAVGAGKTITILDESGTVTGTNTITITRAGTDLINGATTDIINIAYGFRTLVSDGTSKWTTVASTVTPARTEIGGMTGPVGLTSSPARWYNDTGRAMSLSNLRASVGTAPQGSSLLVDVRIDGTSTVTLTITAGTNTSSVAAGPYSIANGSYVDAAITQVGSSAPGADLVVSARMV